MTVAEATFTAAVVTAPSPNATELFTDAFVFAPSAILLAPLAFARVPVAIAAFDEALELRPVAIEP